MTLVQAPRESARERLRDALRAGIDVLHRWVGDTVPEVDTGERAPMRQRVPA